MDVIEFIFMIRWKFQKQSLNFKPLFLVLPELLRDGILELAWLVLLALLSSNWYTIFIKKWHFGFETYVVNYCFIYIYIWIMVCFWADIEQRHTWDDWSGDWKRLGYSPLRKDKRYIRSFPLLSFCCFWMLQCLDNYLTYIHFHYSIYTDQSHRHLSSSSKLFSIFITKIIHIYQKLYISMCVCILLHVFVRS